MIVGVGIDMVDVARIEGLLRRYGARFVGRVFTETEARYALRSVRAAERLAGRFAVKEAVLKALGTGVTPRIRWKDVETVPGLLGRPQVRLYGGASLRMEELGGASVHVSLSHDGGRAVAVVVIERGGQAR